MSSADAAHGYDVTVAGDGSIPADQLTALGVRLGSHLRVIVAEPAAAPLGFRGSLTGYHEPSWDDFERVSEVGRSGFELS